MDKKLKAKWVNALRSGEYQQCKDTLHDGKGYCCFGVLMKITDWGNLQLATIGWRGENEFKISEDQRIALETMNDQGETFARIADHIERHL